MKPKTLILMGVAITCGLGASYMTSRLLAERSTDEPDKIVILVAKKSLNMGDTIKVPEEWFQEKLFPRGEEPSGAIIDIETLKNRVLKRPLRSGDFVTPEDLLGDKDGDLLNAKLPPGYRALGVRVNIESSASGFATLPLSRVDLISTVRRSNDKDTYSQVLLENVLVLAADDKTIRDESGKPMPSQIVTLALKPEEAMKVTLASEMGTIRLMLRKLHDLGKIENPTLTYESLKTGDNNKDFNPEPVEVVTKVEAPKVETPKVEASKTVAKVEPFGKAHRIWVSEGSETRRTEYLLDESNQVIEGASARNGTSPPRPTQTQTPPAPKTDGNPGSN